MVALLLLRAVLTRALVAVAAVKALADAGIKYTDIESACVGYVYVRYFCDYHLVLMSVSSGELAQFGASHVPELLLRLWALIFERLPKLTFQLAC